jgi:hypothetical protein
LPELFKSTVCETGKQHGSNNRHEINARFENVFFNQQGETSKTESQNGKYDICPP